MTEKSILLIDDDELLCDMVAQLLELEGYSVAVAHDGRKGLEMVGQMQFDCILLDLVMPKMDGLQFMRRIAEEMPGHPPIVVISASVTNDILAEGRDFGVRGMIRKPVTAQDLVAAIEKVTADA
ncbi:response regulator [Qipengyuania psychrotolerans]|uniref:Response regulator n=1 Tax=Qipengyuania psychrotolerans TaxID=2867238 RepID=A0ABX8ZDK3_9SPHN|nr:response regulator [Qipengyuania psychrotolerans]QZD87050.1 response regulator [Qipengyuania psychrotolerans]